MHARYLILFTVLFSLTAGYPQDSVKILVPAGIEYKASTLHRIFFGDLWRDVWVVPVDVAVLDLNKFAGGLTPLKKGGGFQTKSLRFKGSNGKEYKFRSVNKDPRKVLPPELQETFVADIVKDQISTSNPYAILITTPILNTMGILQAEPEFVFLPDTDLLGEFRSEFANTLGTIEEHPEEGFADADKVKSTFNLFDEMEEDNDNVVDAADYLKVRLVDMYIGDWDRHTDQWRWAGYNEGDKKIWRPIPRDRDQAFARFNGLFPWITSIAITQLEGFGGTFPEIEDLTWSGRFLDRRLLSPLTKTQWDSVTSFVLERLTDTLIIEAVNKLPRQVFALEGDQLIFTLIQRRNRLKEASETFYKQMFKFVEIRGSNKREFAEVLRLNEDEVSVNLFKRDKDSGGPKGDPLYSRKFNADETREIRLFMLGGDDYVIIKGEVNSSIDVIVNAGTGDNILIDSSIVHGCFLSLIPFIPDAEKETHFYTVNNKTVINAGPSSTIKKVEPLEPKDDFEKYEPKVQDYGHDWRFIPWFELNSDVGVLVGGGPILYEFGYQVDPYVYRMELKAGYANKRDKFKIFYQGDFYTVFDNLKLQIKAFASGLEVLNFYGLGNETKKNDELAKTEYYRVEQKQYGFLPSVEYMITDNLAYNIGLEILLTDTDPPLNSFLTIYQPYGVNNVSLGGINTGLTFHHVDHLLVPTDGYFANVTASYYPGFTQNVAQFLKGSFDARYYFPLWETGAVIALKSSGEKIWGNFPFFKSAFLGGINTLRGYERDRFAGDASLLFNSEIRTFATDLNVVFPMKLGVILSAETGRVFYGGQTSHIWHSSFGGGFWLSIINKEITLSFTAANSTEDLLFYFQAGFAF